MLAIAPADFQYQDTYFVVAHFHYVMMGGTMFAFIGGLHYWWPKFTGKMYSEKLGNWACALAFIGFNLTFGSQFFLGVAGMPRRYYNYLPQFEPLHQLSTIGSYILGFGFFLTHINNRPADCSYLEAAWLASGTPGGSGIWFNNAFIDLEAPTGGLFGGAAIVNVASGTYINYNAEAIDGFSAGVIHTPPGSIFPNLSSANGAVAGAVTSYVFDRGRLITSNWLTANNGGANAVSAVLMREAVFNEYEVDPNLGAASEWIVTFPTRKLYVGSTSSVAPWTTNIGWSSPLSGVCERVSGRIYNREENTFRIFDFSPGLGQTQICWEANPL